jgi:hypothetical protein
LVDASSSFGLSQNNDGENDGEYETDGTPLTISGDDLDFAGIRPAANAAATATVTATATATPIPADAAAPAPDPTDPNCIEAVATVAVAPCAACTAICCIVSCDLR